MTRHLLMDPAFPDIVGAWAAQSEPADAICANDNDTRAEASEETLLLLAARAEIAATRLW